MVFSLLFALTFVLGGVHAFHPDEVTAFACAVCQDNHFCANGSIFECPQHSHSTGLLFPSASEDCVCVPGYLRRQDACLVGTAPHYYRDGLQFSCPNAKETRRNQSTSPLDCGCVEGFRADGHWQANCARCGHGTYNSHWNSTICLHCPDFSDHYLSGSTNIVDCQCDPGHTGPDGGPCVACPGGFYKSGRGLGSEAFELDWTTPGTTNSEYLNKLTYDAEWSELQGWVDENVVGNAAALAACDLASVSSYTALFDMLSQHPCANRGSDYTSSSVGAMLECIWTVGTIGGESQVFALQKLYIGPGHSSNGIKVLFFVGDSDAQILAKVQDGTCWLDGSAKQSSYPSGSAVEISWGSASTGSCVACPPGQYSNGTGASQCVDCHVHSTSPANATFLSECRCEPGFEPDGPNACRACAPGTFKNTTENAACRPCPAGQFQAAGGATACEACAADAQPVLAATVCQCNAGFTLDASASAHACVACGAGEYKTTVGDEACTDCPDEQHTSALASTAISACFCVEGFEGDFYSCAACAAGTYKDFVYWTEGSGSCLACPDNTDSPVASTALTNCTCLAGFAADHDGVACVECGLGEFKSTTGTGQCETCAENTFQNETGQTACYACMARSTTEGLVGQDSVADCICRDGSVRQGTTDDPYCNECQPGEYAVPGQGCQTCPATSYTTGYGSTECIPCLPNSVANETRTGCVCNAGFTCHEKRCAGADITQRCSSEASCPHVDARYTSTSWKPWYAVDGKLSTIYQADHRYYLGYDSFNPEKLPLWWRYDLGRETGISKLRYQVYPGDTKYELFQRPWRIRLGNSSVFESPENYDIDTRFPDGADVDVWLNDVITRYLFIWKPASGTEGDDGQIWFDITELTIHGVCPRMCPDGNCTACAANHYKETVSWERCTACQADAQSPAASTQESDCKCNRGFAQDGPSTCVMCPAGQYSDQYDSDNLDAQVCVLCPNYTFTDSLPADDPGDCIACRICNVSHYWSAGCAPNEQPLDELSNAPAVCTACSDEPESPLALTTAVPSSISYFDSYNRYVQSCVCKSGAYLAAGDQDTRFDWLIQNQFHANGVAFDEIYSTSRPGPTDQPHDFRVLYDNGAGTGNPAYGDPYYWESDSTVAEWWLRIDLKEAYPLGTVALQTSFYSAAQMTWYDGDTSNGEVYVIVTDTPHDTFDERWTNTTYVDESNGIKILPLTLNFAQYNHIEFSQYVDQCVTTLDRFRYIWIVIPNFLQGTIFQLTYVNVWSCLMLPPRCLHCTIGSYKPTIGNNSCSTCPYSHTTTVSVGSNSTEDCLCDVGFLYNGTTDACETCAFGTYKDFIGDTPCHSCSVDRSDPTVDGVFTGENSNTWDESGTRLVRGSTACTCNPGFQREYLKIGSHKGWRCLPCSPGYSKSIGGDQLCTVCPAGTYQDEYQAADCKTCPANSDSSEGLRHCICNAGFQNSNGTHYQSDGTACQACSAGKVKTTASTASCQTCARCGADERVLRPCNATHDTLCQPCQANSNSPTGNLLQHCYCDSGYEFVGGECQACAVGKAKAGDSNNSVVCQTCAPGTFADFTGSAVCSTCNTYCPTGEFVSSECVSGSNIACANCTRCAPGFYGNPVCGPLFGENRLDTNCSRCLVDHYCRDDALTACPVDAHSPVGSAAVEDCVCRKGMYEAADGTCAECGLDFYCYRDARTACPAHSVTLSAFADHILDCNCRQGYYREWHDDTYTNFSCLVCRENDYCFNNSAFNCSDDRMVSVAGSAHISQCLCVDGFFNTDDNLHCLPCPPGSFCADGVRVNCSVDRWTAGAPLQTSVEDCLCRPGTHGPVASDTSAHECRLCPHNFWCPGDNSQNACPRNSSTLGEGVHARTFCLCDAGFAAEGDPHECQACASGFYKSVINNSACDACRVCRAADGVFEAIVCSTTVDTLCSPCSVCVDGHTFEAVGCSDFHDTQCANCSRCDFSAEFELTPCTVTSDDVCVAIDKSTCPDPGFYRGAHTTNTDSYCMPCQSRHTPYFGYRLDAFSSAGRVYDDPFSCRTTCLGASVYRDPRNHSLGCRTCEDGNVLLKTFASDQYNCSFACRSGYDLSPDGTDCVVSADRVSMGLFLEIGDVEFTSSGLSIAILHSNFSRYVVTVSRNASTTCHLEQCCYRDSWRLSPVEASGSLTDACSRGGRFGNATGARSLSVDMTFEEVREVGWCVLRRDGSEECLLTFQVIDLLRANLVSKVLNVRIERAAATAISGPEKELVSLDRMDSTAFRLFSNADGSSVVAVVTTIRSLRNMTVSTRARHMSTYQLSSAEEALCGRLSLEAEPATTFALRAHTERRVVAYFKGHESLVRTLYTLDTGQSLFDVAAVRNISDSPAACYAPPANVTIAGGHVYYAAGMGRHAIYDRHRQANAEDGLVVHGSTASLVSLIAVALADSGVSIALQDLLAAHAASPESEQLLARPVVFLSHGRLDFNHTFKQACLNDGNCEFEYLSMHNHYDTSHTFSDCSNATRAAAQAWTRANFGVPHDAGHVDAICDFVQDTGKLFTVVLTHTLKFASARGAQWAAMHNNSKHTLTHIWANFLFHLM